MKCPLCDNLTILTLLASDNVPFMNSISILKNFRVEVCSNCSYIFQSTAYSKEYAREIQKVYENYDMSTVFDFPRQDRTTIDSLSFVSGFITNQYNNVLEIGSNRGDFLYLLKQKNPQISILGIEPTKFENLQVPTLRMNFQANLFSSKFDIIIIRHVFEHICHPKEFVKTLKENLTDDGFVYVEVPNIENCLASLTEDFAPDHVSYFSQNTLYRAFNEEFTCISIENSTFLRAIFKLRRKELSSIEYKDLEVNWIQSRTQLMNENKKKAIYQLIQYSNNSNVIFYGVSYYFYYLLECLKKESINLSNCYFFDDNYLHEKEERYGLKRLENFANSLVVTCSDVPYVQNLILNKVLEKEFECVLLPWRGSFSKEEAKELV